MSRSRAVRDAGAPSRLIWVIGLVAGFASAFLRVDGGLLLVMALIVVLRRPVKQATGTSLTVMLFISIAAVMADWELSGLRIQWTWAVELAAGALLGSIIGGRLIGRIADHSLWLILAGAVGASFLSMATGWIGPRDTLGTLIARAPFVVPLLLLVIGVGAGAISVLIGAGGGIVTIPALTLLFGDLSLEGIRSTSILAVVVAAAIGARQHAVLGHTELPLTEMLVPAGLAGAVLGVVAAAHAPTWIRELVLAAPFVFVAAWLLVQGLLHPAALSGWPSPLGRSDRQADASAPVERRHA